jgi:1,2-diacylglycerol 3-alpha-glucosyltransferase
VRKTILRRARRHLSRIFPIVPASAVFLHEVYGVPHSEMELLPLGMDADLGREVRTSGAGRALRERLRIGPRDLVLFTGGKLAPPKRTELAIEAFLALGRTDAHLLIAGESAPADAAYKARLLELAAGNPRIHFLGWLGSRDIYACLAAADVALFPASQSILWQQAIGMGLPLIVGNTGHQDVSYLNGHDNIVILPNAQITAERIREALHEVLGDERLRARMAAGARTVAEELLTWDRLIHKTLQLPG